LRGNANPSDWRAFSADELAKTKLMMGNQVLRRADDNTSLGNGSFGEKRPVLAASALVLTREVGELDNWTPTAIRARQGRLNELAGRAWRRTSDKANGELASVIRSADAIEDDSIDGC
jgi:hypothetical protein